MRYMPYLFRQPAYGSGLRSTAGSRGKGALLPRVTPNAQLNVLDQTEIENTCGIQSEGSNFWCGQWIVVVSLLGMSVCI